MGAPVPLDRFHRVSGVEPLRRFGKSTFRPGREPAITLSPPPSRFPVKIVRVTYSFHNQGFIEFRGRGYRDKGLPIAVSGKIDSGSKLTELRLIDPHSLYQ